MHEHKSASPVAVDLAFRQGKPRWEYFMYLRELQRSTSTKARHPWRWILRSGKANPDGNTLCISENFNAAPAQKHVTRGDGSCVQARQAPTGILFVFPRGLTPHEHKRRVTRGCGFCVQARQTPMGILCVFPRGLTMHEHKRRVTVKGCACCEALLPMWRCCAEEPRSRVEERRRRRGR